MVNKEPLSTTSKLLFDLFLIFLRQLHKHKDMAVLWKQHKSVSLCTLVVCMVVMVVALGNENKENDLIIVLFCK